MSDTESGLLGGLLIFVVLAIVGVWWAGLPSPPPPGATPRRFDSDPPEDE